MTFTLRHAGWVVLTVRELFPVCRIAGKISVHGHAGINRVFFTSRLHGRALTAGTYNIVVRPRGGGVAGTVRLVLVDTGVPSPAELAAASSRNACNAASALASTAAGSGDGPASGVSAQSSQIVRGQAVEPSIRGRGGGGQLAALSPSRVARSLSSPLVVFVLAAAVLLLGLAALPERVLPDPRLTELIVSHRIDLALAGAAALAAALVALALG